MSNPIGNQPDDDWSDRYIGDRNRYHLRQRLGMGSMGNVFLAVDTVLNKQVALKLLKTELATTAEMRTRFEHEVRVCAALESDHIVKVSDYGVTTPEGLPFYVMEYLRGQSLGQLLHQQRQLPVERAVNIITQVCDGLSLAHKGVTLRPSEHIYQVVHRDLKPDNIFLVPTMQGDLVKILDFGIAKICKDRVERTQLTYNDMFLGTYHYAAPEQLEAKKDIDGCADIYSLGIILYEMLSGTDPFGLGLKTREIPDGAWALAHLTKPVHPLRSQPSLSNLSPLLEAVVLRCLKKSPSDRFNSVNDLKIALEVATTDGQSPASGDCKPPIPTNPVNPKQRRLLIGGSITSIAIAVLGVYALYKQPGATSLEQIQTKIAEKNYQGCVALATAIPQNSRIYTKAQTLLQQCQLSLAWQKNQSHLQAAQKALNQSKWHNAISEANKVTNHSYWQQQIEPIIEKAKSQITAPSGVAKQPRHMMARTFVGTPARRSLGQTTSRASTRTARRGSGRITSRLPARPTPKALPRSFPGTSAHTVIKSSKSFVPRPQVNKAPQQPCRNWQQRVQQRGANSGC